MFSPKRLALLTTIVACELAIAWFIPRLDWKEPVPEPKPKLFVLRPV